MTHLPSSKSRALLRRAADTRIRTLLAATSSTESMMRVHTAVRHRMFRPGKSIFITCMPKTGSTFLLATLRELTGYAETKLTYAYERSEQDLYLPHLIDNQSRDTITRHHTRATGSNLELVIRFRMRPVILVRGLFDVAVSVRDHLVREGYRNFPALHAARPFLSMGPREQLDFVIAHAMPWYVQYYVGWYEVWRYRRLDTLWLRYEDLVADWPTAVRSVLEFHDLEFTNECIEDAIRAAYGSHMVSRRLNKGVIGRGEHELSDEQRAYIRALTRHYPSVDFSFIGIDSPRSSDASRVPA